MNRKFALSVLSILAIFTGITFANFAADATVKDLLFSKIDNGIFDVSSPQVSSVVINEVYGGGGNSGATFNADFIELYNAGATPFNLNGYSLQYAAATTNSFNALIALPNESIPAGGYYLVQTTTAGSTGAALPTPNFIAPTTVNLSGTTGNVLFINSTTLQAATCPASTGTTDKVAYGTGTCFETAAAPATTNTTSVQRIPAGADTDNNSVDFQASTPTPQSTSTAGGGTPTPTPAATPTATATVTPTATATAIPTPPPCPSTLMATTTAIPAATCPATPTSTPTATPTTTPVMPTPTVTPINTPTATPTATPTLTSPRQLRVQSTTVFSGPSYAGQPFAVDLLADALGDEASYNFTLSYNNAVLPTPTVAIGTAGGSLSCNTSVGGQITCSVMNFPNNNPSSSTNQIGEIAAGNNQVLVRVTFTISANTSGSSTPLTLTNVSASNDAAQSLAITSTNGTVTLWFVGPPTPTPTATPTATPTITPTVTPTFDPTPLPNLSGTTFYAVSVGNQLVRFERANPTATPSTTTTIGTITGLQTGENILGIDFRPANGQLYALGSTSRLYTISLTTGAATQVGSAGAFTLSGTNFGFDFNPAVDRIRVVSDTGQNLRLNPNDGTLAATDTPLNPAPTGATAAAYSNNFAGAATTTLYIIDTNTDMLYLQGGLNGTPSPNGGTLTAIGPLGFDATGVNGFDIGSNGIAYAVLSNSNVADGSNFYTINLATGAATPVGQVGNGLPLPLRGLAVAFGSAASGAGRGTALDFDGDRRADYSVFRPGSGSWFIRRSSDNGLIAVQFGLADDVRTPGDYDGDGRADISVWRPSNGTFYILRSSDNTFQSVQFGQNGDEPVARDYNGDGRTDFAVVRRANGLITWFILTSNNFTFNAAQFGLDTDVVAPGDYDGDGRFDLAVYRGSGVGGDRTGQATFFVQRSTTGFQAVQFGLGSDLVVPGDYDGDGRTDFAVVRAGAPYTWYILSFSNLGFGSSNTVFRAVQFGTKPFLTTQADYDGDGRTDVSVWNPQNGTFYTLQSSNNAVSAVQSGQNGDVPIANFDTH